MYRSVEFSIINDIIKYEVAFYLQHRDFPPTRRGVHPIRCAALIAAQT